MSWQPEIDELRRREAMGQRMGGPDKIKRQHDGGKLTVRERIDRLLDKDSFHEVGAIAGKAEYDSDGNLVDFMASNFVMGRGRIDGRAVVVEVSTTIRTAMSATGSPATTTIGAGTAGRIAIADAACRAAASVAEARTTISTIRSGTTGAGSSVRMKTGVGMTAGPASGPTAGAVAAAAAISTIGIGMTGVAS